MQTRDKAQLVHAYQAFEPGQGALSFEAISDRFKEVGWPKGTSKATVRKYVIEIVMAAQEAIEAKMEELEMRFSYERERIVDLSVTIDRLRESFREVLAANDLVDLFSDPGAVVERCSLSLLNEALKVVESDSSRMEDHNTTAGYLTFIGHICDKLSYSEFIRGLVPTNTTIEGDRGTLDLQAVLYYLEEVFPKIQPSDWTPGESTDLEVLKNVVNGKRGIPLDAKAGMKVFQSALDGQQPNLVAARLEAFTVARLLKRHILHKRIEQFKKAADISGLASMLDSHFGAPLRGDEGAFDPGVGNAAQGLDRALDPGDLHDRDFSVAEEYSRVLAELEIQLRYYAEKIDDPKRCTIVSKLSVESAMRFARNEQNGTRLTAGQFPLDLNELVAKRSASPTFRRVRPYELYLFAHQQNILGEILTVQRSKLNPEFEPTNPWKSTLSILECHHGVDHPDLATN